MSVSQACNNLYNDLKNKLSGGYTALATIGSGSGYFYLSSGVCVEYGTYPANMMDQNGNNSGYTKTITLKSGITTFYFAIASSIYTNGFPDTNIFTRSSGAVTIGCNVNISGIYVSWMVIGTK